MNKTQDQISRRRIFKGAGAAGALAAVAVAVPLVRTEAPPAVQDTPAPDTSAGYRLSEHVLRYYETTRI